MAYQQMEIIGEGSFTQLIKEHCIQTLQFDEDCISSTFIVFYSLLHDHSYIITVLTGSVGVIANLLGLHVYFFQPSQIYVLPHTIHIVAGLYSSTQGLTG